MRTKRSSSLLDKADARATALQSIDPKLVVTEGVNVAIYRAKIDEAYEALDTYNRFLAECDAAKATLHQLERDAADLSDRMLKGVASKFGRDGVEYESRRRAEIEDPTFTAQRAGGGTCQGGVIQVPSGECREHRAHARI